MFLIHETNLNLVTSESGDPPSLCYLREPQPLLTLPHGQGPKRLLEATVLVSAHMGYGISLWWCCLPRDAPGK